MIPLSWRDAYAWKNENLPMNTSSNEACKLFDITLTQLVQWRELDQFGGIEGSIEKMINADPNFVLGHVLNMGIELIGSSSFYTNKEYSKSIKIFEKLSFNSNLTKRELNHIEAIKCLCEGNINKSCDYWENILIDTPNDMLAIKFAHDAYFYLGQHFQMRDSIARVLPFWKQSNHLYNYLYGMHSFGLVQSNYFNEAYKSALNSLNMNKHDGWATHTICHYNEYRNDFDSGIKFLNETEPDWSVCNLIAPHNYWHLCLYHIEKDEHEVALEIFDNTLCKFLPLNRTLDMVDLISLLFRLKLDKCKIPLEERWSKLKEVFISRINDHGYTFNDSHIVMLLSASGTENEKKEFFKSLNEYLNNDNENYVLDSCNNIIKSKNGSNYLKNLNRTLGVDLFESICLFDQGQYEQVVDLLAPIKYDLIKIGGSNAQRDLFQQILVQSALLSDSLEHKKLGLSLINERLSLKPNSNLTKRIFNRFSTYHY